MWVSQLEIKNIRSFATSGEIKLSKNINILLGANNAGKSTIIRTLYLLQQNRLSMEDIRIGETLSQGSIILEDVNTPHFQAFVEVGENRLTLQIFANRQNVPHQ
jgi:predicted ATPase